MANRAVYRRYFRACAGVLLVLGGAAVLVFGLPSIRKSAPTHLQIKLRTELYPGNPGFPKVASFYPTEKIEHFEISDSDREHFTLHVAHYNDSLGSNRSAIFFPPDSANPNPQFLKGRRKPFDLWLQAVDAIKQSTDSNALFVTWWDNAQRIDWLTGRNSWQMSPTVEAFSRPDQRELWKRVSGGFTPNGSDLKELARWLTMNMEQALSEIQARIPKPEIFFLVCMDDLARLPEIATLTGKALPFETRLFKAKGNIHTLIRQVKRWANEKGNGHYMVQQLPIGSIRAWRITTAEGEKMLLARLLPFTSSLANPINNFDSVYRSGQGGYLSVYRWKPL